MRTHVPIDDFDGWTWDADDPFDGRPTPGSRGRISEPGDDSWFDGH